VVSIVELDLVMPSADPREMTGAHRRFQADPRSPSQIPGRSQEPFADPREIPGDLRRPLRDTRSPLKIPGRFQEPLANPREIPDEKI